MSTSKKGISALQLQRNLGLGSYRTAWHLAHRIRLAMKCEPFAKALQGDIEVDETYVGGKPRPGDGKVHKRGRGTKKTPVVALVQRNGGVRTKVVERVNAKTLHAAIKENVAKPSIIVTDEYKAYNRIGKHFDNAHFTVNHGIGQYVNGPIHTNTAESFFALLKRGVHGTFHHVSKRHLPRYCDEFGFRWDNRKVTDIERTTQALKQSKGKRLPLAQVLPLRKLGRR
jgi:transposase-like protein